MTLRDQPDDYDVRDIGNPAGSGGKDWWAARCKHCRTWITKYDHSRDDATRFATSSQHRC